MKINVVQILLFLGGIYLIYWLFRLANTVKKEKRLNSFSLEAKNNKNSLFANINRYWWKFISGISNGLEDNKTIQKISKKYDKYILTVEHKYKSANDYFTIKMIVLIMGLCLFMVGIVFELIPNKIEVFILVILLSYFIPDLFWQYQYQKKLNKINKEMFNFIKYFYSYIKRNYNLNEALSFTIDNLENPIKDEVQKILNDLEYGLSLTVAFKRFYERSKLKSVLFICKSLELGDKLNLGLKVTLDSIYEKMAQDNKEREKFNESSGVYSYLYLATVIIPPLVYFMGINIKINYFTKLFDSIYGYGILLAILAIYTTYIYIMNTLLEGYDE